MEVSSGTPKGIQHQQRILHPNKEYHSIPQLQLTICRYQISQLGELMNWGKDLLKVDDTIV